MGEEAAGIMRLIASSLKEFVPDLSSYEEEAFVDLIAKLVAMTSSPEFSMKEVERCVLEFIESSS